MYLVDLVYEFDIGCWCWVWHVIHCVARDVCGFGLFRDAQRMTTVDYRFALSNLVLMSALSKKSFFSVNSLILVCKFFKSTLEAVASLLFLLNISAAFSKSWAFHWVI